MVGTAYVVNCVPALEVEALDREDEPDRADLDEVLERLAPPAVARGDAADQRHVAIDDLRRARSGRPRGAPRGDA